MEFLSLHKNLKSLNEDIMYATIALMKLQCIVVMGAILAHLKIDFISRETLKILNKLLFVLLLPCLIFTNLGPNITLPKLVTWWFIPVNVIISTTIGFLLGIVVVLVCRPPKEFYRFTIIATAFGNTNNIPLAIVASICQKGSDNPFGPNCYSSGIAYVSFSQLVSSILINTLVYHMMEPIVENRQDENKEIETDGNNDLTEPFLVDAEWYGMDDKNLERHYQKQFLFNSMSELSHFNFPNDELDLSNLEEPRILKKIRIFAKQTPIKIILQPPTIASLLAIIIGMIPQLKAFVYGEEAPLDFITDSLTIIAEAMVPLTMIVMGRMLAEGPNKKSRLGTPTTIGIIISRLLVLPVIGIGVVYLADRWNLLIDGDGLYRFVLLLQYSMPSAILLGAVASFRGYAVSEACAILFWQYVLALFSLSFYISIFFKVLFSYV
ncbi:hypothetical protein ACFE04_009619 [Oxalis oulophora]